MPVNISELPWSEYNVTENFFRYEGDTLSGKRKKRGRGNHRYEIELVTIEMPPEQAFEVEAILADASDQDIEYIHPTRSYTKGTKPAANILSNNNYSAGLRDIAFKSTGTWQLKAGDHITFNGHTKVYRIATSTNLQSGVQVIRLTFPLQENVSVNETVNVNDVKFTLVHEGTIEVFTEAANNQDVQIAYLCVEK